MRMWLNRKRIGWLIIVASAATLGIVISLLVLGGPERDFTATAYSDVVRFEAAGVATLQVRIFDLSGKVVWDSGVVSGGIVDWNRMNDVGERLAYGAYIYSAQGWNAQGDLIFQKNGKLALMPGDKVQLQAAPVVPSSSQQQDVSPFSDTSLTLRPMAVDVDHSTESWAFGQLGIGTTNPGAVLDILPGTIATNAFRINAVDANNAFQLKILGHTGGVSHAQIITDQANSRITVMASTADDQAPRFQAIGPQDSVSSVRGWMLFDYGSMLSDLPSAELQIRYYDTVGIHSIARFIGKDSVVFSTNSFGIGTSTPTATLEVHGSATNLFALYDPVTPADPKFRVEKTGTVFADGAYYGAGYYTGSADVAERINVSEWVEEGCVVEIDQEHPGFFRKASTAYSRRVAGIISTAPGVILGNSFDEATNGWEDSRPVLAVTGRVPCKVIAENGAIEIGDLLVASSTPGVAMKGNPEESMGAVVGKAMEALREGTGVIMVQVMLR